MHWIYFNLALSLLVFIVFYAIWCFVRSYLLFFRLNAHYDEFENDVKAILINDPQAVDDIYREEITANVLAQRQNCFHATSRLNAFSVFSFDGQDLSAVIQTYVPHSAVPQVNIALDKLRAEKCNAVEFYIRYCRLSGYIWALWAIFSGLDAGELRHRLSKVLEFILRPEVNRHFHKATLRWDQYFLFKN